MEVRGSPRKMHSADKTPLSTHPSGEVRLGKKPLSSFQEERALQDPDLLPVPTFPNPRKASSGGLWVPEARISPGNWAELREEGA